MKVLILSCNTGQGHNSVAAALKERFDEKSIPCDIVDALSFISKPVSKIIELGHKEIYRRAPRMFSIGYKYCENNRSIFGNRTILNAVLSASAKKLYKLCITESYDVLIASHSVTALVADVLINRYSLNAKAYFVATDYTCSPPSEMSDLHRYFIPAEELTEEFIRYGIDEAKISPCGIPVRRMFFKNDGNSPHQKSDKHQKRILMMCGSMGCGPMRKLSKTIAEKLTDDEILTVVCGSNKRIYRALNKRFKDCTNIDVRAYENDMSSLMEISDIYLTKPGGISVTEAAVKRLPLVLINAVAGCESYNMNYFIHKGCAVTAKTVTESAELCLSLLRDDAKLEKMKASFGNVGKSDSAEMIADIISLS